MFWADSAPPSGPVIRWVHGELIQAKDKDGMWSAARVTGVFKERNMAKLTFMKASPRRVKKEFWVYLNGANTRPLAGLGKRKTAGSRLLAPQKTSDTENAVRLHADWQLQSPVVVASLNKSGGDAVAPGGAAVPATGEAAAAVAPPPSDATTPPRVTSGLRSARLRTCTLSAPPTKTKTKTVTTRRRNTKAPGLVASGVSKRLSSNAPPEALIGHKLKRFFRGYGTFTGTVTEAHKRYDKVYVLFDDGDRLLYKRKNAIMMINNYRPNKPRAGHNSKTHGVKTQKESSRVALVDTAVITAKKSDQAEAKKKKLRDEPPHVGIRSAPSSGKATKPKKGHSGRPTTKSGRVALAKSKRLVREDVFAVEGKAPPKVRGRSSKAAAKTPTVEMPSDAAIAALVARKGGSQSADALRLARKRAAARLARQTWKKVQTQIETPARKVGEAATVRTLAKPKKAAYTKRQVKQSSASANDAGKAIETVSSKSSKKPKDLESALALWRDAEHRCKLAESKLKTAQELLALLQRALEPVE